MKRYEALITLLGIEKEEDERAMIDQWIARDGIEKVYQECLKIFKPEKKKK